MSQKCIYLDFDGVLHPKSVGKQQLFTHMPLLASTLAAGTASIVISSSWRLHEPLEYLRGLFPQALQSRVLGCTAQVGHGPLARWREIHQHAALHGVGPWVALDDAKSEFPPDCENLILCDGTTGLQAAQLLQLRRWLQA